MLIPDYSVKLPYPLYSAIASGVFSKYVLVYDEEDAAKVGSICMENRNQELRNHTVLLTSGGKDRNESVHKALKFLKGRIGDDSVVFIHDADRVLVTPQFLKDEAEALGGCDAITPVTPIHDSLIKATRKNMDYVPRDYLYSVQTPQVFRYGKIYDLYENGYDKKDTDDFRKALYGGLVCQTVRGDVRNFKVTDWDDVNLLMDILK